MRIHRTSGCLLLNQHLCFLISSVSIVPVEKQTPMWGFPIDIYSVLFTSVFGKFNLVPILNRNIRSICFFFSDQWSIRPSLTDDTSTPSLSTTKSSFLHTLSAIKFSLGQRTTAGWCGVGDYFMLVRWLVVEMVLQLWFRFIVSRIISGYW